MDGKSNFELRVGVFVFIGLIIFTYVVFSIGDFYFKSDGRRRSQYFAKLGDCFGSPVLCRRNKCPSGSSIRFFADISGFSFLEIPQNFKRGNFSKKALSKSHSHFVHWRRAGNFGVLEILLKSHESQ